MINSMELLLKDKPSQMKTFKNLSENPFESGSMKLEVVGSTLLTVARAETVYREGVQKARHVLIGCSLKSTELFVIGCWPCRFWCAYIGHHWH